MKFLAIENELEVINAETGNSILKSEAESVYQLYLNGHLREIYFNENNAAILIMECASKERTDSLLSTLPLMKIGFINFSIMELKPYIGSSRLFV